MKKFFALLIAAMLLMTGTALAAKLDLSFVEENDDVYTLDVNTEANVAFVESRVSVKESSFTHKYESKHRYNFTMFDILVTKYGRSDTRPVFRLWVTYCADNGFQNIDSVSFVLGNKMYTFSDVNDGEDWLEHDDQGYVEQVLIRFGENNFEFIEALDAELNAHGGWAEAKDTLKIKMILHGDEDITVELGQGFILDYVAVGGAAEKTHTYDYLDQCSGNDLSVSTISTDTEKDSIFHRLKDVGF